MLARVAEAEGIIGEALPLERDISPRADARALWATFRAFRRFRPDITNVGTPKAGLVGGLAALLAGVPARIYVLHGLRFETATGAKRRILELTERIACACAHRVLCVSPSVRQGAIAAGVVPRHKAQVLGSGTVNGVDLDRFSARPGAEALAALRARIGVEPDAKLVGFVGRFTRDKGMNELVDAFAALAPRYPDVRLLLLGGFEDGDPVAPSTRERIEGSGQIVWPGAVPDTAAYYHLMDLLVLPTYREGFPTVCLEAAAAGIPVVTTEATGARDAVVDGVTGRVVPVGDAAALAAAIAELLDDPARARALGAAAQDRVRAEFLPQRILGLLGSLYEELTARRARRPGRGGSDHAAQTR